MIQQLQHDSCIDVSSEDEEEEKMKREGGLDTIKRPREVRRKITENIRIMSILHNES